MKKHLLLLCLVLLVLVIHAKFFEYPLPLPENVEGEDVTEEYVKGIGLKKDSRFDSPFHHSEYFMHESIDNDDLDQDDIDILHDVTN